MSLLHQSRVSVASPKVPNKAETIRVARVQLCFTCTKIKTLQECTSVLLECKGLPSNIETKSSILQVICQLLRVQGTSLESLMLEDENLPFCPNCLKAIAEIIILREKLFQIETEIREKLKTLEASVAECFEYEESHTEERTPEEGSIKYDDLRIIFQKQVMEEHMNKQLLQEKILEMNQNPRVFAVESMPSMVQFHFEKNVFSTTERKSSLEVKAIGPPILLSDASTDTAGLESSENRSIPSEKRPNRNIKKNQINLEKGGILIANKEILPEANVIGTSVMLSDASTDTKDLEIFEDKSIQVDRNPEIIVPDYDFPIDFEEVEVSCDDETFNLVPVDQELPTTSDDSDYGSPSKKSKTDAVLSVPQFGLETNTKDTEAVVATKKKIYNVKPKLKRKKASKSRRVKLNPTGSNAPWLKNLTMKKPDPVPSSSKQQNTMPADSGEEFEDDEEDDSDSMLRKGDTDSVESGSSDGDEPEPQPEANEDKNKAADVIPLTSSVSISELCKKHTFKPKNSLNAKTNNPRIEPTFVKIVQQEATFTAKDKTIWTTKEPNQTRKTRAHEILRENGGLVGPAKDSALTPTEIFKLMFPPNIVETIVKHTNAYATYVFETNPKTNQAGVVINWSPITLDEMYAYIGVLLYFGAEKKRNVGVAYLWTSDERYSIPTVAAAMTRDRFRDISRFIRLDDKVARMTLTSETEVGEVEHSRFSYISEVFEPFVENMQSHLRPYDTLIVDEMLVKFRGSAKFRVYMKSKPGKYGLKLWAVCDVETGYVLKIALYEGKVGDQVEREHGKKVVLNLVKKYFGSGRGVTMDNFFTSKSLGEELMKQNMSMLGTLNHNRMDVIPEFVNPKGRELQSSIFAFQGNFTMVSYVPKKGRAVLLLSTQHHSAEINSQHRYKPKMILDYNMTKGGVDTADGMIAAHSCQRTSGRWPVKILYALLDIAAFNSFVVHKIHKTSTGAPKTELRRQVFLRNLSEGLMKPLIAIRIQKGRLQTTFTPDFLKRLGFSQSETMESRIAIAVAGPHLANSEEKVLERLKGNVKVGNCHLCRRVKKHKKSRSFCFACGKPVCLPCGVRIVHCRLPECTYVPGLPASVPKKNLQSTFDLI